MKLKGRFALITGASQGLGAEIARHYVSNGASVMLCARSADKLAAAQQSLAPLLKPGARIVTITGDVGEPKHVDRIFEKLRAEFPRLDILVNNAGVYGPMGNIEDVDWEEWVDAIRINLLGLVCVSRAAMPMFRAQRYGKIINISGGGAANPMPGRSYRRQRDRAGCTGHADDGPASRGGGGEGWAAVFRSEEEDRAVGR